MTENQIPESLTKENFWNEILEKYPKSGKLFCDWIDQYKERVNWDLLFADRHNGLGRVPKFHEIPLAMQIGVIIQFFQEQNFRDYYITPPCIYCGSMESIIYNITEFFKHHENLINIK